jgi:phage FluMu gp28-like protein
VHDLTVFWIIEKAGGVALTRKIIVCDRETFDSQEAKLYELLELPNLRRACIDNTGIGRQFVERAQKRFGEYRVEAVTFTPAVKEELAYPVRAAFEDRSVRIPGDKFVRADLRGVRKETTATGNIRFAGERGADGHCDRFWALALALHAGKTDGGGLATLEDVARIRMGGNRASLPHLTPRRLTRV